MEFSTSEMESSFDEIISPFDVEWKFKKADLIAVKDSKNEYLNGKHFYAFNIPGLQYHVRVFPYGSNEERREETWIFLFVYGLNERKIAANFTISVESAEFSAGINEIYLEKIGFGATCNKTSEFFESNNKFFVNGEITIRVKGIFKIDKPLISITSRPFSMQWKFKEEDLKANKESENSFLFSKGIKVSTAFSDVKYFLSISPNDVEYEKQPTTLLYLFIKMEKEKKIEAIYDFSIDTANFNAGRDFSR